MFRGLTEHEEGNNGFELSLELSIGPSVHDHGKKRNAEEEMKGASDENDANLDVSFAVKKPEGVINGGGFLKEKQFLEAHQLRARAWDREDREREVFSPEDSFWQKDRNGGKNEVGNGLQLRQTEVLLLPQEGCGDGLVCCGEMPIPSCGPVVEKDDTNLFRLVGCVNDSGLQGTSHRGESESNTGSHLSCLSTHQRPCSSTNSPLQPETDPGLSSLSKKPRKAESYINNNQTNNTCLTTAKQPSPPLKETSHRINKPPMPCVSTTGNGPNGKTIRGFLQKYTQDEVSITCVCHGSSFSPAEFVEHAGGIDISHPLKHITVIPLVSLSDDKC